MYINKEKGSSYSFKAPSIAADANKKTEVIFPTFEMFYTLQILLLE